MTMEHLIAVARGDQPADLLLRNGKVVNVNSGEIMEMDIAVAAGHVAGFGPRSALSEIDLQGRCVAPGFIDAHVHIESAMASPAEFARAVLPRGTTTVVADPHEIANVLGIAGIEYMLQSTGLTRAARDLGTPLTDPFMTLSFLALPVIPELKITDMGLVDVNRFEPIDLFLH